MIEINIKRRNPCAIFVQILCVTIIIISYLTTRQLMYVAGLTGMAYVFMAKEFEYKYALMFFLLPFVVVFSISKDRTSLFMFLRISLVISAIVKNKMRFNKMTYITVFMTVFWFVGISAANETSYRNRVINIILWLIIGLVMQVTLDENSISSSGNALCNGTILSGIIGMNLKLIPNLQKAIGTISTLDENGDYVTRFMGLWNDPNGYTVFVCMCLWILFFEYDRKRISLANYLIKSLTITALGIFTMSKSCVLLIIIYWLYVLMSRSNVKFSAKLIIYVLVGVFAVYLVAYDSQWLETMLYRINGDNGTFSIDSATTHRSLIWKMYFDYMNQRKMWFLGAGVNAYRPANRAAHNTILQCIYNVGIVGLVFLFLSFYEMFRQTKPDMRLEKVNKSGIVAFLCILSTMFFLDGFFLELFYFMIPLCFVYMKRTVPNQ